MHVFIWVFEGCVCVYFITCVCMSSQKHCLSCSPPRRGVLVSPALRVAREVPERSISPRKGGCHVGTEPFPSVPQPLQDSTWIHREPHRGPHTGATGRACYM